MACEDLSIEVETKEPWLRPGCVVAARVLNKIGLRRVAFVLLHYVWANTRLRIVGSRHWQRLIDLPI